MFLLVTVLSMMAYSSYVESNNCPYLCEPGARCDANCNHVYKYYAARAYTKLTAIVCYYCKRDCYKCCEKGKPTIKDVSQEVTTNGNDITDKKPRKDEEGEDEGVGTIKESLMHAWKVVHFNGKDFSLL